jgi:hypothetical protein
MKKFSRYFAAAAVLALGHFGALDRALHQAYAASVNEPSTSGCSADEQNRQMAEAIIKNMPFGGAVESVHKGVDVATITLKNGNHWTVSNSMSDEKLYERDLEITIAQGYQWPPVMFAQVIDEIDTKNNKASGWKQTEKSKKAGNVLDRATVLILAKAGVEILDSLGIKERSTTKPDPRRLAPVTSLCR